jgi:hypothetical protein
MNFRLNVIHVNQNQILQQLLLYIPPPGTEILGICVM